METYISPSLSLSASDIKLSYLNSRTESSELTVRQMLVLGPLISRHCGMLLLRCEGVRYHSWHPPPTSICLPSSLLSPLLSPPPSRRHMAGCRGQMPEPSPTHARTGTGGRTTATVYRDQGEGGRKDCARLRILQNCHFTTCLTYFLETNQLDQCRQPN